ncbi:2OG-Fe dioxygenase family protein [Aeromonas bivalvium]|uniref:2OG-Fe dioxygenase family protein n=1 Tax=Aeromonas bivalvium TaxID=440079 RepID=UPI000DD072F9|nr:2OG-Fe dioxygenase family protein [Aeromonas bivalvium]
MIDTDITLDWQLDTLPAEQVATLTRFFGQLPVDPYIDGDFRRRRYGRFEKQGQGFHRLDNGVFFQAAAINKFLGDVPRTYADLVPAFVRHTALADGREIGVHQMRICAASGSETPPAPEGVHQDGFDFIGVFFCGSQGVSGGELQLYHGLRQPPFFQQALTTGEYLVLDDRRFYHNAAPILPTEQQGHWDVVVLTA